MEGGNYSDIFASDNTLFALVRMRVGAPLTASRRREQATDAEWRHFFAAAQRDPVYNGKAPSARRVGHVGQR